MIGSPKILLFDTPQPTLSDVWKLEEGLSKIEKQYDIVIIDTPPSINGLTRTAWVSSDRVLVVTEPSFFSVVASDRAMKAIAEIGTKINKRLKAIGVLVNRYQPQSGEHQFRINELTEMFGSKLLPVRLEERAAMQQAQGAARPIHSWPGETAQALANQFDEVLDIFLASFDDAGREPREQPAELAPLSRRDRKAEKLEKKKAKAEKPKKRSKNDVYESRRGQDGSGSVALESFENQFSEFFENDKKN
jgi:Asp-tRNA(Asn)/Glu-tRNA(Gln) amidotransferase C subunit/predicted nuclease with RNAse H fold